MNPGDIILPINRAILPAGFCGGAQEIGDFIAQNMQVVLPGSISFFITQSSEPTVENRSKVWIKTDSTNGTIVGVFTWSPNYGFWLMNRWMFNGGSPPFSERRIFVGQSTDVPFYDGGESSTVSDVTGPFWVVDPAFADKWPLGVGTTIALPGVTAQEFATGANDPKAIGVYFLKPSGRIFVRGN